jgi:N-acetylneuraminic acid mutarotase
MKNRFLLLLLAGFFPVFLNAQWVQHTSMPGVARAKATSFTIGDTIYIMGGITTNGLILDDFWAYSISTDTWLQKPDFPGEERYGGASFVINGKGFISTGGNDFGYLWDLWQYNPPTGTWMQKNGLPNNQVQHENQRAEAYAFSINGKGYLGGGNGWVFGANSTTNHTFKDLWEYNPTTNSWSVKAGFPDHIGKDMAVAAVINNKAYVGLGNNWNQTINYQTFFEYDPATNTWATKANFPTLFTTDAAAFELNGIMYVVGGVNLSNITLTNQIHTYNPVTNAWTAIPNFNGGSIAGQIAVSTGTRAFVSCGYYASITARKDIWELTSQVSTPEITFSNEEAKVYPNPFTDKTTIEFAYTGEDVTLQVYNSCGELQQTVDHITEGKVQVDRNNMPAGLYVFTLQIGTQLITRGKLVIE